MQTVSQSWITAQEQTLVPESFVDITLRVGDPEAQADSTSTASNQEAYSDASQLVKEVEHQLDKYATLESNLIDLGQVFTELPDSAPYADDGYIGSTLSQTNTAYPQGAEPLVSIVFSEVFTLLIPGISITWSSIYGECAKDFTVTAYNGGEVVAQQIVTGNDSVLSVVQMDIQNYNKIEVSVQKWSIPNRRPRIESIFVGIELQYQKNEILSYSHEMFVDPLSAELPKAEVVFGISNLDGQYNPDNPSGLEKYLMERQRLIVKYGYKLNGNIEWIPAGTFYMSQWDTPQNGITATFTARDGIEYMSDSYSGRNSGTLMAIATDAFTQAGLPVLADGSNRWVIDSSLSSINAPSGLTLSEYTIAEVLQYCANAACCVFYQDRQGVFHIEPLQAGTTNYTIGPFVSYKNSESSLTKQLKAVDINDGAYVLTVGTVGETQTVKNPLILSSRMQTVAQWIADLLQNRNLIEGEFRADPRLDALDRVTNTNKFATKTALITDITYTYNGAFRGQYKGRIGV